MIDLFLEKGTVSSGGEDIYWELATTGDGDERDVVVLSHGAGGSHAIWFQQVPPIGQEYRVLTWDSRGFGNSTNRDDAPSPEAAAADLGTILIECGIDRAHLVGQSMGGWHIAAFALANSEKVQSLTFADTVGGMWTPELRDAMAAFRKQGGLVLPGAERVGGHRAIWHGRADDPAHAFLYQALGSFHSPPMHKLNATIDWAIDHADIAALGVPVLFIAGTHDEIFPASLLAASATKVAGARYVEIPAAGHSPYFEQPDAWNDVVLSFLDGG